MHQLHETRPEPLLDAWRHRACRRSRLAQRMLAPLMPRRGYFPDFLTPAAAAGGLEAGIDAVLSTPRRQLRTEVGLLSASNSLPASARSLADGETGALRRLGAALRQYHASVLMPVWPDIAARIERDRLHRTRIQCRVDTDAMLRTFAPLLRWQPPVLCADYPVDRDVFLEGRGLLLVPSYFCRRTPVALLDETLLPVLVYPARAGREARPAAPGRRWPRCSATPGRPCSKPFWSRAPQASWRSTRGCRSPRPVNTPLCCPARDLSSVRESAIAYATRSRRWGRTCSPAGADGAWRE